jgi:hypothetical protein
MISLMIIDLIEKQTRIDTSQRHCPCLEVASTELRIGASQQVGPLAFRSQHMTLSCGTLPRKQRATGVPRATRVRNWYCTSCDTFGTSPLRIEESSDDVA